MMLPVLKLRSVAYCVLLLSSVSELVVSSTVLAWSVEVYRGNYIKSNPQLVGCSAATLCFFALCFMEHTKRRVVAWMEITALAIMFVLWVVSLCRLHAATPNLLSDCGGYLICKGWIAMLCFSWFAVVSLGTCIAVLLGGCLWLHLKRGEKTCWKTYSGDIDFKRREWLNRMSLQQMEGQRTLQMTQKEFDQRQYSLD